MHDYDVVLKVLLQKSWQLLTGHTAVRWLPTEVPAVQNLRVDLLGETADGSLIQVEMQSTNDPAMPLRMLEYFVLIARHHGRLPHQIVLYVGRDHLRMPDRLEWSNGSARYRLIDIRELDCEPFLSSPHPSDNVLGLLARLPDKQETVHRILSKLVTLPPRDAELYVKSLLILAGLRSLEKTVKEEIKQMPFDINILENTVIGPAYQSGREDGRKEGREDGRKEGREDGRKEGVLEGRLQFLRELIEARLGALPTWVDQRLDTLPETDLRYVSLRILTATSFEDLFTK